jgi:two-component system, OmpR family, phosphate regulon response regulator PhoB
MKPVILIVEDESALVALLRYNLERAGFEVFEATDGEEGLLIIDERRVDLVLLDWMLPRLSGIEVCRQLRRKPETRSLPIILLTARGEQSDRIRGLNTGADDYISKPFSPDELIARINALLRRARPSIGAEQLAYSDVTVDLIGHRVIHLGPTEFRLLRFLIEHPKRVFSRAQLIDSVWGHGVYVDERTVDVHIRRLRKALNEPDEADLIRTVRAAGYALEAESD